MTAIEKLLLELLKIPSISGQEEAIGQFLVSELKDFKVTKQFVAKKRFNIIVKKGKSDIYIVVHMDTVPGVVPIKMTKDKIFGRGAIDNKGNIAGAIMAGKKLENINLIFTVGEEVDFAGAKELGSNKKSLISERGKFIIMEPTEMKVMRGQRGLITAEIITRGTQMHSSLKFRKEESAVFNLVNALNIFYQKKWTAFNALIIEGGEASNIIASYAKAKINTRPQDIQEYKKIIAFLKNFKKKNVEIEINEVIEPYFSPLVKEGGMVPFLSEMAFFKNSVLFGVGDIAVAHSANEYVLRKDLNELENNLLKLILKIKKLNNDQ